MLYLAKFAGGAAAVLVHAPDPDRALETLSAAGVEATPVELVEVPDRIFVAEVSWTAEEDGDPLNPGLVPFEACAAWLDDQDTDEDDAAPLERLDLGPERVIDALGDDDEDGGQS